MNNFFKVALTLLAFSAPVKADGFHSVQPNTREYHHIMKLTSSEHFFNEVMRVCAGEYLAKVPLQPFIKGRVSARLIGVEPQVLASRDVYLFYVVLEATSEGGKAYVEFAIQMDRHTQRVRAPKLIYISNRPMNLVLFGDMMPAFQAAAGDKMYGNYIYIDQRGGTQEWSLYEHATARRVFSIEAHVSESPMGGVDFRFEMRNRHHRHRR